MQDVFGECICEFSCLEVGIGLRFFAMTLGGCMLGGLLCKGVGEFCGFYRHERYERWGKYKHGCELRL